MIQIYRLVIYEYIEDSCFIADSPATLRSFTENCWQPAEVYRSEAVTLADIERDFGVSGGSYVMEAKALKRFRQVADARGLGYTAEAYDGDESSGLFAVAVDYRAA